MGLKNSVFYVFLISGCGNRAGVITPPRPLPVF